MRRQVRNTNYGDNIITITGAKPHAIAHKTAKVRRHFTPPAEDYFKRWQIPPPTQKKRVEIIARTVKFKPSNVHFNISKNSWQGVNFFASQCFFKLKRKSFKFFRVVNLKSNCGKVIV